MAKVKIGEVYSTKIGEAKRTAMVVEIIESSATLIVVGGSEYGIEESIFLSEWEKEA